MALKYSGLLPLYFDSLPPEKEVDSIGIPEFGENIPMPPVKQQEKTLNWIIEDNEEFYEAFWELLDKMKNRKIKQMAGLNHPRPWKPKKISSGHGTASIVDARGDFVAMCSDMEAAEMICETVNEKHPIF